MSRLRALCAAVLACVFVASSTVSSIDASSDRPSCRLVVNDADHQTDAERRMLTSFDYDGFVWRHESDPSFVLGVSLWEDSRIVASAWCAVHTRAYGLRRAPGSSLRIVSPGKIR